jgi:hypothetical protein
MASEEEDGEIKDEYFSPNRVVFLNKVTLYDSHIERIDAADAAILSLLACHAFLSLRRSP